MLLAQNILRIDVDDPAKIGESIEGGEFVTFQIMRDRLLRYAESPSEFSLCESALTDRPSEIFLYYFQSNHIISVQPLGVPALDLRPLGVL